jgi:hypothetical protein
MKGKTSPPPISPCSIYQQGKQRQAKKAANWSHDHPPQVYRANYKKKVPANMGKIVFKILEVHIVHPEKMWVEIGIIRPISTLYIIADVC